MSLQELPAWLVRRLDRALRWGGPPLTGIDAADLRQEALLAWWQAQQRYDPGRTVVLDFRARPPWRGLDGRAGRTRRHR